MSIKIHFTSNKLESVDCAELSARETRCGVRRRNRCHAMPCKRNINWKWAQKHIVYHSSSECARTPLYHIALRICIIIESWITLWIMFGVEREQKEERSQLYRITLSHPLLFFLSAASDPCRKEAETTRFCTLHNKLPRRGFLLRTITGVWANIFSLFFVANKTFIISKFILCGDSMNPLECMNNDNMNKCNYLRITRGISRRHSCRESGTADPWGRSCCGPLCA